jgi:23S rRNA (uracil1939-C5)-methyltransferase
METRNFSSERAVIEDLIVDHVGHRGDGVALIDGQPIYVPYVLPNEHIKVEHNFDQPGRASPIDITVASPDRIAPFCSHFGRCGGCAIQHWRHEPYQNWKRQLLVDVLAQAGIECPVTELIDAHGSGRRRITAHARRGSQNTLSVGFSANSSHDIVPIDRCPILDPALNNAFETARALAGVLSSIGKPLDIQITAASNGLDVDIRGSGPLTAAATAELSQLAARHHVARLTRHGELIVMHTAPTVRMGQADVTLPPGSFLQATQAGEDALARLVVQHCLGAKHIADLFCGIGPFALRLAERARVSAYDNASEAVAALQKAAPATRGLKPVTSNVRDLFRRPLVPQELRDFDAVVFDPPRQGAQAQSKQLAASKVPVIVAVSCNAGTFARDAQTLIAGGYRCESVTPVDQFRHTPHIELVARFSR